MNRTLKCAAFAVVAVVVGFGGTACSAKAFDGDDSGNGTTADAFLASLTQAQHDSLCAEIDLWGARPSDMLGGPWRDFIAQADIAGDPDAIYDTLEASCTPWGLPLGERPWRFQVEDVIQYFSGGLITFHSAEPESDDELQFMIIDTATLQRVIDYVGVGNCVVGMRADTEDLLAHLDEVRRVECPAGSNHAEPAVTTANPLDPASPCPTPTVIADALTVAYGGSSYYHSVGYFDILCASGWASASIDNGIDGGFVVLQLVGTQWVARDEGTAVECSTLGVPNAIASQIC